MNGTFGVARKCTQVCSATLEKRVWNGMGPRSRTIPSRRLTIQPKASDSASIPSSNDKIGRTSRLNIAARLAGTFIILPSIPIGIWWYQALEERKQHAHSVETRVRIPNVQTLDEIIIEKIQPGDLLLFDRKCDKCASGPLSAAACILAKASICGQSHHTSEGSQFDHVGIVVPGNITKSYDEGSDLLLLETTPNGIVARPLLARLEMTRSRTVLLIPLAAPLETNRRKKFDSLSSSDYQYDGDKDNTSKVVGKINNSEEENEKTARAKFHVRKQLSKFRDTALKSSDKLHYPKYHSLIAISGALAYALGLNERSPSPISPSAWFVVTALQEAGIAMKVEKRAALDAKPEDFLRDHRFYEKDVIRLRPGWKFLPPVILRETSKSL